MLKWLKRLVIMLIVLGILFLLMFGIFIGSLVQTVANNN